MRRKRLRRERKEQKEHRNEKSPEKRLIPAPSRKKPDFPAKKASTQEKAEEQKIAFYSSGPSRYR